MPGFDAKNLHFTLANKPIALTGSEIEEMNSMKWWHSIPFAPGLSSPGTHVSVDYIRRYMMEDIVFEGKSVLDIGCWDGFQCFLAESMGASRVVGLDDLSQRNLTALPREFAKRVLKSNVEFVNCNVYDLTPEKFGTFDLVFMFGVLYHLVHPMLGMEKACGVCDGEFLLSTHFRDTSGSEPVCVLYPGEELGGDHTNFSGPNAAWIKAAFEMQGFESVKYHTYDGDRITFYCKKAGG